MKTEVLELPSVATHDEMPRFSEQTQRLIKRHAEHKLFAQKYWKAQKNRVEEMTEELFQQNPTLPIKQVVIQILTDLPDFLPSWNIHRVTGYITQTWKELSKADEAPEPKE
ncbi:MAG: hypothetical protein AAB316_17700 [Bacteroidota bacterium]